MEKLEQLRALENGIPIRMVTTEYNGMGVDTLEDLLNLEILLKERTMKFKRICIVILSLTISCIYSTPFSVFYTGDTHGVYEAQLDKERGTLMGGYLVLEEVLNQKRTESKNSIYVDTGDQQTVLSSPRW